MGTQQVHAHSIAFTSQCMMSLCSFSACACTFLCCHGFQQVYAPFCCFLVLSMGMHLSLLLQHVHAQFSADLVPSKCLHLLLLFSTIFPASACTLYAVIHNLVVLLGPCIPLAFVVLSQCMHLLLLVQPVCAPYAALKPTFQQVHEKFTVKFTLHVFISLALPCLPSCMLL
jgi:hypothetical protein